MVLVNLGDERFRIGRGDRIAQLVVLPLPKLEIEIVESLDATERGTSGFGSSGLGGC